MEVISVTQRTSPVAPWVLIQSCVDDTGTEIFRLRCPLVGALPKWMLAYDQDRMRLPWQEEKRVDILLFLRYTGDTN